MKLTIIIMMIVLVVFVSSMGGWGILAYVFFSFPLSVASLTVTSAICGENSSY